MKKFIQFVSLCALVVVVLFIANDNKEVLGSVNQGNEYHATTTRNHNGVALTNLSVLRDTTGALGSVVITGAGTGVINLYDATSTVTNTEWATTTLATIPASTAAGTYTFDVSFQKGLLVEIVGEAPTTTITYR